MATKEGTLFGETQRTTTKEAKRAFSSKEGGGGGQNALSQTLEEIHVCFGKERIG